MLDELAVREPVDIAAIVSAGFLFDFVILYESLVETWTFYPFRLHAFAVDSETYDVLSRLEAPEVEVHRLPGESGHFGANALRQLDLIEHSGSRPLHRLRRRQRLLDGDARAVPAAR